jgi:CO/xanthine dehydrogenase FAD-binding subunit
MKTLHKFEHIDATTLDEAVAALAKGNAEVVAGGTDLVGTRRFSILRTDAETLVNLKTISGLDYIKEEGGMLKIGALAKLEDIAKSELVNSKYTALAQAAAKTASPPPAGDGHHWR